MTVFALYSAVTVKLHRKMIHPLGGAPSLVGLVTVIALYSAITVKNDLHSLTSGPPSFVVLEVKISVSW